MEGVPPSFMDDDVNQLDPQAQEDNFNISELFSSPAEEVPVNQSSMLCNDQAGQKTLVDNDVIYDSIQQTPQLPEPSQTLRSPQFPPHNLQVSGDHNQGHVDQASVIPHIDNMQLENSVPRNFGKSTRSQMDALQVRGFAYLPHQRGLAKQQLIRSILQQQVYASNPGPDSSLKSQNKGLNTQQVRILTELSSFYPL
ncbi:hypothetical protein OIU85_003913 [Salix viminalis]|uniref:Uncharacterized protein n=1 Tax=Salix viminalis TaxID=40686 RepID=A0A9Q0Q0Q6_SALVM|nr:hypothetical protein OIU85_003913 [Salix viminalis]